MLDRWIWIVAALAWAAVIFALSSLPATDIRLDLPNVPGLDKVAHVVLFGILAALLAQALRGAGEVRSIVLAVVLASAYGVTDEWHQSSVPGRDADVYDWGADTIGAVLFGLGVWFLRR